ncbi:hypothetical protein lbkm_1851 [Lachnospiraceae bacterium KM106-2]|nr:hypothetical protein lbkm_1851 [Lachnospiraceae bacterium KM106-2]
MNHNRTNKGKKTVTEVWRKSGYKLYDGYINLVVSPVGSGKTYFIFNEILKEKNLNKVVYLCDTSNLKEATIRDKVYSESVKIYDTFDSENLGAEIGFGKSIRSYGRLVTVMTYAQFAKLLKKDPECYSDIDTFICDEAHNLIKYMQRYDDHENKTYGSVLKYLLTVKSEKSVVMLTATHERIEKNYEIKGEDLMIFRLDQHSDIKRLSEKRICKFNGYQSISQYLKAYDGFKYGKKAVVYTDRIATIENLISTCEKNGLKAVGIWSLKNENHTMSGEALVTRESIISEGIIPDGINVLIINASYETGINIYDKNIEIVIVNSTDPDTQIQARGRVRKDIEMLLIKSSTGKEQCGLRLDEKWLNRALTKEDKKELANELELKRNGKLLKWTSISEILRDNGYLITATKPTINGERVNCHIITWGMS